MSLTTLWWAWQPAPGVRVGSAVIAGNAAVGAVTFAARFSGEALQERLGGQVALEHEQIARFLPFVALAVLFASVLVHGLRLAGAGMPRRLAGVMTSVIVVVALLWTVRAGHSGTAAVWGDIVRSTNR
jgi:branched-subunit amino acid transport protein